MKTKVYYFSVLFLYISFFIFLSHIFLYALSELELTKPRSSCKVRVVVIGRHDMWNLPQRISNRTINLIS